MGLIYIRSRKNDRMLVAFQEREKYRIYMESRMQIGDLEKPEFLESTTEPHEDSHVPTPDKHLNPKINARTLRRRSHLTLHNPLPFPYIPKIQNSRIKKQLLNIISQTKEIPTPIPAVDSLPARVLQIPIKKVEIQCGLECTISK